MNRAVDSRAAVFAASYQRHSSDNRVAYIRSAQAQLVPVQPNTDYDFECYVATEKLETGSAPQIQILDANTGAGLFDSSMAPGGTNDWTRINAAFKTSDKTEAIMLKIMRPKCGDVEQNPVCPIFGSVWYDDFSLKRRN